MAQYVHVEYGDGTEEQIPILNRESTEIDGYVNSLEVKDCAVISREDLDERRYRGVDIERVIGYLKEGDDIIVRTMPKSYSAKYLTIEDQYGDHVVAREGNGDLYRVYKRYWGEINQGEGQPWLRTVEKNESRGEIEEIEIVDLV